MRRAVSASAHQALRRECVHGARLELLQVLGQSEARGHAVVWGWSVEEQGVVAGG